MASAAAAALLCPALPTGPNLNCHATMTLTFLSARCCFKCAESVTVCPDGHLVMIDKYGAVRAAPKHPDSSTQLDPEPIAHLGPGRPLGFTFDAEENVVVCDALKVRAGSKHATCSYISDQHQAGAA